MSRSFDPTVGPVLVTGGSGYLGGWTVVELLRRGYRVRTTVRDLKREAEVRAVIAQKVEAGDRLSFHAADLLADRGWDEACAGAAAVMHVASPLPIGEFKDQDLVRPGREGVARVWRAAERAGVRHLVMTSSTAAADAPLGAAGPADETVWTDPTRPGISSYARAKTLAEGDAWKLAEAAQGRMTLATVLPGAIQGLPLGPDLGGSLEMVARLVRGQVPALPRISFPVVETSDVVDLHIRALTERAAAGQRFLAASNTLWMSDMAKILKAQLGERAHKISIKEAPDLVIRVGAFFSSEMKMVVPSLGNWTTYSAKKAERLLGWRPKSAEEALLIAARGLIADGLA